MQTAKYKVRNLNVLDIRSIAKILKEVGITRNEIKEMIENLIIKSKETNKTNAEYVGLIMPLGDIVLDLLSESESFWDFLKDVIMCEDLSKIPLSEIKNIIKN